MIAQDILQSESPKYKLKYVAIAIHQNGYQKIKCVRLRLAIDILPILLNTNCIILLVLEFTTILTTVVKITGLQHDGDRYTKTRDIFPIKAFLYS